MNKIKLFDRTQLKILSLSKRKNKSSIEDIVVSPYSSPKPILEEHKSKIIQIADNIIQAKNNNSSIIVSFGAHLIKNGLGLILSKMVKEGYITHLATNGAGSIHDWELAYQGKTEEDVKGYISKGQFGLWEETGKYLNLAIILGAFSGKGYGDSVCKLIHTDNLQVPEEIFKTKISEKLKKQQISPGNININHLFKQYSIQNICFNNIPFTVHPGFGYDIIYSHPLSDGASIGAASETDFLRFAESVSKLEKGVYLSIGSAIMSPMIFEKSLSMARNIAFQEGKKITDFLIAVNDIQQGNWNWDSRTEPPKSDSAYYLRFCKTFNRMGARELYYIQEDNRDFLLHLYHELNNRPKKK